MQPSDRPSTSSPEDSEFSDEISPEDVRRARQQAQPPSTHPTVDPQDTDPTGGDDYEPV